MSSMSFIEKLLGEVEVEWGALEDLVVDKFWIMPATPKFNEAEKIPYITSKNIKGGNINFEKTKFISQEDYLNLSRNRPILAGDILISMIGTIGEVARVKESDLDFYGQNMYLIRLNEKLISSTFFLHFFDSPMMKSYFHSVKNNSGQGYLKANNIEKLQIPIPCPENPKKSLEIQAEIVHILDTFTALTAALTAELSMRKKQYNYYRDKLLTFEEGEVEWKALGDVVHMRAGQHISASKIVDRCDDEFRYPCFGGNGIRGYVKEKSHDGDYLLIGRQGALCGNVQRMKGQFYATEHAVVVTTSEQINIDWAFHLLTMMNLNQFASKSAQPGLAVANLLDLKIPVPSLDGQARVASILDKFDTLTHSISEGLPREIELRQKQYEYYRDLLLSFPKLAESEAVSA